MESGWEGTRTEAGSYKKQAGEKLGRPRSGRPQEQWRRGPGTSSKFIRKIGAKVLILAFKALSSIRFPICSLLPTDPSGKRGSWLPHLCTGRLSRPAVLFLPCPHTYITLWDFSCHLLSQPLNMPCLVVKHHPLGELHKNKHNQHTTVSNTMV